MTLNGHVRASSDDQEGPARARVAAHGRKERLKKLSKIKADEKVMDTNNSSIVSKRSVERLYFEKPHFFRYFVKKPIRRSPLINRGYWLRMHAVEHTVTRFLQEPSEKRKIVLNLGCGYDPLPFQCLSKYPEDCKGVTFVDVDYPELMFKKGDVIREQQEMKDLIAPIHVKEGGRPVLFMPKSEPDCPIVIRSERYMGVGCDLQDIARLSKILEGELQLGSCLVLCTAEVSITYMHVDTADALIRWAAKYDDVRFCLLEQLLPHGQNHPFAQKMMQHFENLGTPLNCVRKYPTLKDQENRFMQVGYHAVKARTLWDLWRDSSAVSPEMRHRLNQVEPFDEWEEFALFSSHYFVLDAVKSCENASHASDTENLVQSEQRLRRQIDKQTPLIVHTDGENALHDVVEPASRDFEEARYQLVSSEARRRRKFGAMFQVSGDVIGLHGGIGNEGRLSTTDRYGLAGLEAENRTLFNPPQDIQARVCHTITALDNCRCLLVGGRSSPDNALRGCWIGYSGQWKSVHELPVPLYRHCATAVSYGTEYAGVLIFGGRTTGGVVVNSWFLWRAREGWEEVSTLPAKLTPRFGAAMVATNACCGVLLGGMAQDGTLCDEIWEWTIEYGASRDTKLQLVLKQGPQIAPRMGSCLIWSTTGLLLIGGISDALIPCGEELLCLAKGAYGQEGGIGILAPASVNIEFGEHRPLLVGHSALAVGNALLLVGGGAVCFSFGSYWNLKAWTLNSGIPWIADMTNPPTHEVQQERHAEDTEPLFHSLPQDNVDGEMKEVSRVTIESAEHFNHLTNEGKPFVMEGLDFGTCTSEWTADELTRKIEPCRLVTVHQAQGCHMNFQLKDFDYVRKPFGEFIQEACNGSPQYLRSLNTGKPAEEPARFDEDFPGLKDQFHLPKELQMVACNQHSSPLRISGPVNMWLHYDVMANVLCQVLGTKVVVLYPPMDAVHFKIPPGASSSPVNVFHCEKRGHVEYARPYLRAILSKGDVLYIPPLWLHTVSPLDNLSISINVFFRSLKTGYSAGRDVYGNRDLQAYESGRKTIERTVKSMDNLPKDIASAYLVRLGEELVERGKALGKKEI